MATQIIATAMVICNALSGTLSNRNAPKPEPMTVRRTEGSNRLRLENALTDKRQRATHAHKRQSQHVRCNCNVSFDAQGHHDWNCVQRCAASHDADRAREEEHSDQEREFDPGHATMIIRRRFTSGQWAWRLESSRWALGCCSLLNRARASVSVEWVQLTPEVELGTQSFRVALLYPFSDGHVSGFQLRALVACLRVNVSDTVII